MSGDKAQFDAYIGIDYSGAATPDRGLTGLRVYTAEGTQPVREVRVDNPGRRHWSRRAIAGWLQRRLAGDDRVLVGIDHGFSFPIAWFEYYEHPADWDAFLADFRARWPTDRPDSTVEQIRRGLLGAGRNEPGDARWRRLAERPVGAKSVFHFDVPGSVAKSTHAGLPWLDHLRRHIGKRLHAWPFDGWSIPRGCSAITEIYPSIWAGDYPRGERTQDQHDAYVVARALQQADRNGELASYLQPALDTRTRAVAACEGWILGVTGP
ncbi:hypothetical protein [Spiribacter vilamensis]|uniref:DUF429 domain-containing protein n=1 Tax=Spiribacter vilamensis TaxID=531306 RepID=A0A4Q8CZ23_9GAMM|nr:hypothetical protein [Spiribacter vilamensis]RZU98249.1 hypothetical protein EV698_0493 [Spiribacter vilamensis]TVO60855.1 hypothetical protein FPL09_01460 [Spiribacter vilamensis]